MQNNTVKSKDLSTFPIQISRLILFLFFQAIIALALKSWVASQKYWLLTATLTNIVSIIFLVVLFRREGEDYIKIFRFKKEGLKKDILIFTGLAVLSSVLVFFPGYLLANIIWGDPDVPTAMMFGPVPEWLLYVLLIAFPLTIAFAELATYFVYIMSKLKKRLEIKFLAVLVPVVFLSLQHCTMPFIPDINFIIYRALVFLPFASLIGISIYYRPSLFPYFAVFHGILDLGTVMMFFNQ